jgi:hypothetical protein
MFIESQSKGSIERREETMATKAKKRVPKRTRPHACDAHCFAAAAPSEKSQARGKSIDELDLTSYARAAAEALLAKHPQIAFASGRRNSQQQAHAMAGNVAANRRWIEQTYAKTAQRAALQGWVDSHPRAKTAAAIEAGLAGVMAHWSDAQKRTLSQHFSGEAFDIQPVPGDASLIASIKALPRLRQFLQKEGGLVVWHAGFK